MTKKRRNRPDVDSLLPDVDEEIQGGGAGEEAPADANDEETQGRDDMPSSREGNKESKQHDDMSTLARQLEVLMEGPDEPFRKETPKLDARANGYLSSDVERALQQATSVLKNQFDGVSKSLLMNYAIRVALWDLRENADESQLVRWLENVEDNAE